MTGKHPKRTDRPGVDQLGRTELHYACVDRDVPRIRQLLAEGFDPNATDDNNWTPLHFACQSGSVEAVRSLLEAGASIDPLDSLGNTPLVKAVFNSRGEGDIIKMLRAAGADPHVTNVRGVSPVSLARTIGNYNVRQFFVGVPESPPT